MNFNPTLNEDGSIKNYDLKSLVQKGIISSGFLSQMFYKIAMINSGVYLKNIRLEDGYLPTYYTASGLFNGFWSPHK